ncbi:SHOCT domain-containing protein [Arthrobacter antioxidans]|uniref:SHOCT domain-containing protein n=1 Tax=Arthrobacter antioxidans TaxID=2895818 RepID=UPI001FFF0DA3|nr:SHOCT domain-containing protein [Arthrobacter antioxidans]
MDINLWEVVWVVFTAALFAAYLAFLFVVLVDIFRNESLSGWSRALWVVLLVLLPLLASLAYLFAHGQTMALRNIRGSRADPGTAAAPTPDPTAQVASANELLRQGAITQEEFERLKRHSLQQASGTLPTGAAPRTPTG